jgi:hypothetical protein
MAHKIDIIAWIWNGLKKTLFSLNLEWITVGPTNYLFNFDAIPISDFSQLRGQETCPSHKS